MASSHILYISFSSVSSLCPLFTLSPEQPIVFRIERGYARESVGQGDCSPGKRRMTALEGNGAETQARSLSSPRLCFDQAISRLARSIAQASWTDRTGKDRVIKEQKFQPWLETIDHQGSRGQTAVDHDQDFHVLVCFPATTPTGGRYEPGKPYLTRDPDGPRRSREALTSWGWGWGSGAGSGTGNG